MQEIEEPMDTPSQDPRAAARRAWPRYEAAELGFRHYWYPVLAARQLKQKPVSLVVCGEKIVLVRDRGAVRALKDRCPHRGVPLSAGRREFPGTLSCLYHGWTFDLASGELIQALTDGPDSPVCGNPEVCVKTYPVIQKANLIWIYIGDGPPPPAETDIPETLLADDAVVEAVVERRKGNWRYAMENACDEAHAKYLHRYTPYYFFFRFPGWQTDARVAPSEDGKWLNRSSKPVFEKVHYPGLGSWPRGEFWRWLRRKPIKGSSRLPGVFAVDHHTWHDFQFFVPVDKEHHLTLQVSMTRAKGLKKALWKIRYWLFIRTLHHWLLNSREDGFIVENMDAPPEWLFRPDISIVGWRRWCEQKARRSPSDGEPISQANLHSGGAVADVVSS
jgi:phenylpropionate dioxygenase-like ring-hydroxylating dioxygenase large terminal subunit